MNEYEHILNLIERFAAKFPEARQDAELLGVSVSSSEGGKAHIVLNVRESTCEQFRERHQLPDSVSLDEQGANPQPAAAINVSIQIKPRPVLAAPSKPSRRFSSIS